MRRRPSAIGELPARSGDRRTIGRRRRRPPRPDALRLGTVEDLASTSAACAAPVWPTRERDGSASCSGAWLHATDHVVGCAGSARRARLGEVGRCALACSSTRCTAGRGVAVRLRQREALLPGVREALARRSAGVEELACHEPRLRSREQFSLRHERDAGIAALLGLALGRGERTVGDRHQREPPLPRTASAACRSAVSRPHRAVRSAARISSGSRARPTSAAFSFSRRAGWWWRRRACGRPWPPGAERVARRLDRHRHAVLVEARDRALALPGRDAEDLRDRGALHAVGNVGSVGGDSDMRGGLLPAGYLAVSLHSQLPGRLLACGYRR